MPYITSWKVLEDICVLLSKRFLHKSVTCNPESYSEESYTEWRDAELRKRFSDFDLADITGKSVLDFGCGYGSLGIYALRLGAASVVGIDLDEHRINVAAEKAASAALNGNISFRETAPDHIPVSNNSIDTILCFDVLEHIMEFRSILGEWHRVLKPTGKILVDWSPWTHPHAHHLWTIMPLPWVHLLMPEPSVLRVCAKIYELPEFKPRFFHFDENDKRKKNPYSAVDNYGDLNKLTVRRFETEVQDAGMTIQRKQVVPFSGRPVLAKQILAQAPVVYPYFCSRIIYEVANRSATSICT